MGFEKFCAKCGKVTDSLVSGICANCYFKKHSLFEVKDFVIERCVKCGKVRVKGKWGQYNFELIAGEVAAKVKVNSDVDQAKTFVELEPLTENDFSAHITITGFIDGVLLEQKKDYEFYLEKVSCDSCMKLVSNYREAIIQLRSSSAEDAEGMMQIAKELLASEQSKDSLSAVVKTLKGPTGYDLWVGSKKAASRVSRKLAKLYKTTPKISKKLIGEEEDRAQKYRITYLVKK